METALKNHVILDMILKNLSFQDLKSCRKVCTLWNTEATKVIARRKTCIIRVRGQYPCSALSRLEDSLASSSVAFRSMFIGMALEIDNSFGDMCTNYDDHLYENLMNMLPAGMKYLYFNWSESDNCAVQKFTYSLVRKYENSLQELVLNELRELHRILQHSLWRFTNLKTLRLENYIYVSNNVWRRHHQQPVRNPSDFPTCLYQFLERTEKLELVHGIQFSSLLQVPSSKYDAIWALEYDLNPPFRSLQAQAPELYARFAAEKRQLGYLAIKHPVDIINNCRPLCKLIEGSKKTLEFIRFKCPFVQVITQCLRSGLDPLPSVQTIGINLSLGGTTAEVRKKIAQLIYYVFPSLKVVSLDNCANAEEDYEEIFQQFQNISVNQMESRVSTLFFVNGDLPGPPPISLEFVKDLFPNVTHLEYVADAYADLQSVCNMWTAWPQLVEVYVRGEASVTSDFDAEFCGISSEEAEYLRAQSTEYLEKVHIVPTRPAMYFLKDLRKLGMEDAYNGGWRARTLDLLTEVTGCVVFKRMNDLEIQITGSVRDQGLKRLCDTGFIELDTSYERRRRRKRVEMWLIE